MQIKWEELGFNYMETRSNIRSSYRNGVWTTPRLCAEKDINLSIAANCLHYGQAVFEGLKAFACKDGKVRIFRPDANAKRINQSLRRILAPEFPEDVFVEAVKAVVKDNLDYVPPYGTGGSLYIRPVCFGTSAQIGVDASKEYEMIIMVMPVGPYYKGGIKGVDACLVDDFDRAAPLGTGMVKVAGNYAAGLLPGKMAKEKGFPVALFTDSVTHEYIDEFGTSNFVGITRDGTYVTPKSESILGSITNDSLRILAADMNIAVEERAVHISELADFAEVGACGTAVVITPVCKIAAPGGKVFDYGTEMGPTLQRLYDRITAIQYGEIPDTHNWNFELD